MSSGLIHLSKLISDFASTIANAVEVDCPLPINLFESETFCNNAEMLHRRPAQFSALFVLLTASVFYIVSSVYKAKQTLAHLPFDRIFDLLICYLGPFVRTSDRHFGLGTPFLSELL